MLYGQDRDSHRQLFFTTWQKFNQNETLSPLEKQIIEVIKEHPEYHTILSDPETHLSAEHFEEIGEANPFLHMGLHLAIRDQVATNLPHGITTLYQQLCGKFDNHLTAEHLIMDHLVEMIWQAQKTGKQPDQQHYLEKIRAII